MSSISLDIPCTSENNSFQKRPAFVCYLDDSDNDKGPCLGIAGYLSTQRGWDNFEKEADSFLNRWRVDVLRGKDFNNGHNCFKKWAGKKKRDFVEELFFLSKKHVISGINSTVNKADYQKLKRQEKTFFNLSPLGCAFSAAVMAISLKDFIAYIPRGNFDVNFIVESGNKNNENLVRYFDWLKTSPLEQAPRLGTLTFVGKRDCRAIQLADFLAFHGRREAERWAAESYLNFGILGDALSIMEKHIFHRHDRIFYRGSENIWGIHGVVPEDRNIVLLPWGGLK